MTAAPYRPLRELVPVCASGMLLGVPGQVAGLAAHEEPIDGPVDEELSPEDDIEPGDLVTGFLDGVPHVQTCADDVDTWLFT